tara:strand:- start:10 stop:456 length:447 start_codon:yes stop_codon:yes gene_type:complete
MRIIKNVRHIGIVVSNINKSLNFFHNILGFKIYNNQIEKGEFISKILNKKDCNVNTIKLIAPDGNMIELLCFKKKHIKKNIKKNINIDSFGITHISFTVFDINKVYKILKNEKIKFLSKPVISSDKKVKVVFCKVFDNYFFELVETLK